MDKNSSGHSKRERLTPVPVLVATTAMLTFIPFWRAAAIVLNDLASSAYYAGGIAEKAFGDTAPWFILAVMLFSYGVRSLYMESSAMFVRGGVYRVVKEAMGGGVAKFSVSALMFDYVLTGPISGVSAGQYLAGFLNDLFGFLHLKLVLPPGLTAAGFAVLVTLYFWWLNIKGIPEAGEKALRIMQAITVMAVVLIGWCTYTVLVRGAHLPPWPLPQNLRFPREALGWLQGTRWETIGVIGIFMALGHSVLAMSGEETLAQVYREIEHPKLPNLKKAAFVIFVYSLLFTSLVSFFAVMLIPDPVRSQFHDNLIGGLAMHLQGPLLLRLIFHGFVVVVGALILSGAVNTSILGSNGVLNRVSEDGVLTAWFRRPHRRFGTSYRIISVVAGLQLLTILISRGNVIFLGNLYAFGVIWSFTMNGVAVLVLRHTHPGEREFRVPLNIKLGRTEVPAGAAFITLVLLAIAVTNLFTKQAATIAGVGFSLVLLGLFTLSEKYARRTRAEGQKLDQFNVEPGNQLSPETVGCRSGSVLVMVRDEETLYPLQPVLKRVDTERQDVVVLHMRFLPFAASTLVPEQLFRIDEKLIFTRALAIAEKEGKPIRLALTATNHVWHGMLRAAQDLDAATLVLGLEPGRSIAEAARHAGLAWEGLRKPKPRVALEILLPSGHEEIVYLGPHAPHLTRHEIDLLHALWLKFANQVGPEELHHHDIVRLALDEIRREIAEGKGDEVLRKLKQHLKRKQAAD